MAGHFSTAKEAGKGVMLRFCYTGRSWLKHKETQLFICFFSCPELGGLWQCHDALRHSEYAAGARWVWPHWLVITVQHQAPNYQLTPEPTPTCPKARWPSPPPQSVLLHSRTQRCPPEPRSVLSKHAPRDATRLCDVQTLRDICPHLCFCPSVRTLNYKKEEKVNLSVVFPGSYKSESFRGNWERHGFGSETQHQNNCLAQDSQRNLHKTFCYDACLVCSLKKP